MIFFGCERLLYAIAYKNNGYIFWDFYHCTPYKRILERVDETLHVNLAN